MMMPFIIHKMLVSLPDVITGLIAPGLDRAPSPARDDRRKPEEKGSADLSPSRQDMADCSGHFWSACRVKTGLSRHLAASAKRKFIVCPGAV